MEVLFSRKKLSYTRSAPEMASRLGKSLYHVIYLMDTCDKEEGLVRKQIPINQPQTPSLELNTRSSTDSAAVTTPDIHHGLTHLLSICGGSCFMSCWKSNDSTVPLTEEILNGWLGSFLFALTINMCLASSVGRA
ncbi:hypothetical protein OUZ56_023418 [Daphnia magna]|uniref:Uncharacterized protein n=1 Tax=Daphnia magna TaxID=35525 RepID=A0ABR0AZ50_9CRUS|nr:hypothetical protein OUZ56_023418 [Daphnia magna]